jgi:hypothetical protein
VPAGAFVAITEWAHDLCPAVTHSWASARGA